GAVIGRARGDVGVTGMGTTMAALVAAGGQVLIGHVGDSRAYLLHDGALRRVTDDHSLVEELVREGRLTPEQAESHPQRNIVTRALGLDEPVEVDLYPLDVVQGDRIILCSDGLTTMVRERDIERIARNEADPQRAAEQLVGAARGSLGDAHRFVARLQAGIDATSTTTTTTTRPRATTTTRPRPRPRTATTRPRAAHR